MWRLSQKVHRSCLLRTAKYVAIYIFVSTVILHYYNSSSESEFSLERSGKFQFISRNNDNCDCAEKLPSSTRPHGESFTEAMAKINWLDFKAVINSSSKEALAKAVDYYETVSAKLSEFVKKPIPVPINETCGPPPLQSRKGFNCTRLQKPRKVGMLLNLGFEVDALEVNFHELDAVVDKFFLAESSVSHNFFLGVARKPLIWDSLRCDPRFAKFKSKVVHFVIDDASTAPWNSTEAHKKWRVEDLQDKIKWTRFLEWNSRTNYFSPDDLLGFGHEDEIPHRDNVFTLKHCKLPADPVDIGIWFPCPYLDAAFRSDHPVRNHSYTFGNPAFWTVAEAKKYFNGTGKPPNRMYGKSRAYLLGGMHMSAYFFPPYRMLKRMSCTSCPKNYFIEMIEVGYLYGNNQTRQAHDRFFHRYLECWNRTETISRLKMKHEADIDAVVKLPWFIQCNPDRYPCLRKNGSDLRLLG